MIRTLPLLLAALALPAAASAEPVSPWVTDVGAKIRLVDAGVGTSPAERLAAIAIRLEPGWKTYWRQPGANGVPPRFDTSGSENLAEARVLYPTPERVADEDGVTNVYHGAATLPVVVRPRDPTKPVGLKIAADFGVCERICVPAHAAMSLTLAPGGAAGGPAADDARAALAKVPAAAALGADGPLGVLAVARTADGKDGATIEITVASPAGGPAPDLFAETGDGEYAPAPQPAEAPRDGHATFRMAFDEPEPPASGLRLTLSSGGRAVETVVPLDAIERRP